MNMAGLEARITKLEGRRVRVDKRPVYVAYGALLMGVAAFMIAVVNATAIEEINELMAKQKEPPKVSQAAPAKVAPTKKCLPRNRNEYRRSETWG
jgi:hypothetical protein